MRGEQIRVAQGTRRADEVVVPDIGYLGVLVSKNEQSLLEFAHLSALRVHMLILFRDRSRYNCRKRFQIDVPDLRGIVKQLRRHEREELVGFLIIFRSLVSHFLPDAVVECCPYDGLKPAGVRFIGMAWISS
jgi:hypothetical protein